MQTLDNLIFLHIFFAWLEGQGRMASHGPQVWVVIFLDCCWSDEQQPINTSPPIPLFQQGELTTNQPSSFKKRHGTAQLDSQRHFFVVLPSGFQNDVSQPWWPWLWPQSTTRHRVVSLGTLPPMDFLGCVCLNSERKGWEQLRNFMWPDFLRTFKGTKVFFQCFLYSLCCFSHVQCATLLKIKCW